MKEFRSRSCTQQEEFSNVRNNSVVARMTGSEEWGIVSVVNKSGGTRTAVCL